MTSKDNTPISIAPAVQWLRSYFPHQVSNEAYKFDGDFFLVLSIHRTPEGMAQQEALVQSLSNAGIVARFENRTRRPGDTRPNHCVLIHATALANNLSQVQQRFTMPGVTSAPSHRDTQAMPAETTLPTHERVTQVSEDGKVVQVSFRKRNH